MKRKTTGNVLMRPSGWCFMGNRHESHWSRASAEEYVSIKHRQGWQSQKELQGCCGSPQAHVWRATLRLGALFWEALELPHWKKWVTSQSPEVDSLVQLSVSPLLNSADSRNTHQKPLPPRSSLLPCLLDHGGLWPPPAVRRKDPFIMYLLIDRRLLSAMRNF